MSTSTASVTRRSSRPTQAARSIRAIGWLMATWCVGFAMVNIVLESTGRLSEGEYSEHAVALTVMNWLVVGLKLVGAVVAVLTVTISLPTRFRWYLAAMVWGAFATLAVYAVGSVFLLLGMVLGLMGDVREIDAMSVAYLAFFLTAAVGWGVLAVSYSRRHGLGRSPAVLGVLAAPVVLGFVLVVMPTLLEAMGLMPSS